MLNQRQRAFAENYAQSGNATEAAKAAGYSSRTAYSQGQRLLKNDEVKKYLHEINERDTTERIAAASEIQETLTGFLRNDKLRTSDRIKSANALLKCSGNFIPSGELAAEEAEQNTDNGDQAVQIILPAILSPEELHRINAIETDSGEIIPIPGTEQGDTLIYLTTEQIKALEALDLIIEN